MNLSPETARGISIIVFFILVNVLIYLKQTSLEKEIKNNRKGLNDERKRKNK